MDHFPLTKDQVVSRGWRWADSLPFTTGKETVAPSGIPDEIRECNDDILAAVLACKTCRRNYKIIAPELALYRKMGLALPRHCPDCRHHGRLARRLPKKLWDRPCGTCGNALRTAYSSDRPEAVCCETCYLREVY